MRNVSNLRSYSRTVNVAECIGSSLSVTLVKRAIFEKHRAHYSIFSEFRNARRFIPSNILFVVLERQHGVYLIFVFDKNTFLGKFFDTMGDVRYK